MTVKVYNMWVGGLTSEDYYGVSEWHVVDSLYNIADVTFNNVDSLEGVGSDCVCMNIGHDYNALYKRDFSRMEVEI